MTLTASNSLEGLLTRGQELEDHGAIGAARSHYERALTLYPESPLPALNLGNVAFSDGDIGLAERWYRRALATGPCAPAELNLGNLCLDRQQADAAFQHYQRASKLRPAWPPAILGMANSLIALGQHADAEAILNAEIAGGLRDRACLHLLAEIQHPRSASAALATLALDPAPDAETWALRAKLKTILLDNRGALNDMLRALAMDPQNDYYRRFVLFTSMLLDDVTPAQLMSWVRLPKTEDRLVARRAPAYGRRLKIGYLSCDFRRHAAAHYLYPIISGHDRRRFEVWLLSGVIRQDAITSAFKRLDVRWLDLSMLQHDQARDQIMALELDIIVECSGNTVDSLLPLLDIRLAPLQLSMIGLNLTTGSPTIDYRVVSKLTDPLGVTEAWHSEKLLHIRSMECVYHPLEMEHTETDLPALSQHFLSVGFFNNATKLNLETIRQLKQLLDNPRIKVLIVGVDHPETVSIINCELQENSDRCQIFGRLSLPEYLAKIRSVDIAWDSYPYSGSTTTLDCLLQGVPVVTLASDKSHSRSTSARLSSIGFDEFIKKSDADRIAMIYSYIDNPTDLAKTRKNLSRATRAHLNAGQSIFSRHWDESLLDLADEASTERTDDAETFPDDFSKTDHCLKAKSSLNVGGSMS